MPQTLLVLSYVFGSSSSGSFDDHFIHTLIERDGNDWERSFLPQEMESAQSIQWWSSTRKDLVQTYNIRAVSVDDFKIHLGYLLHMMEYIVSAPSDSKFMMWRSPVSISRPFGSRASIALICYSFLPAGCLSNFNPTDPWLFDLRFVIGMLERLKESPLFKTGVTLSELKRSLIGLEHVFSLEDERSVQFQPYIVRLCETEELKAYYHLAFTELDPSLMCQIWQRWEGLTNPMYKGKRLTTCRDIYDTRLRSE
jgi:hypothetical protein